MSSIVDTGAGLLLASNVLLLGSGRVAFGIDVFALQSVVIGAMALAGHQSGSLLRAGLFSGGAVLLKGLVFPRVMHWALRESETHDETEPLVGYTWSILLGALAFAAAHAAGPRLPVEPGEALVRVVPLSLSTIFTGLFLIVARRSAIHQVLGYLVLENGILLFGVMAEAAVPMLVELGVMMDVFVAVLVMSIVSFRIQREFDHMDVDQLDKLRG